MHVFVCFVNLSVRNQEKRDIWPGFIIKANMSSVRKSEYHDASQLKKGNSLPVFGHI